MLAPSTLFMTLFCNFQMKVTVKGYSHNPKKPVPIKEVTFHIIFCFDYGIFNCLHFLFALYYFFLFKQGVKKKMGKCEEQKEKVSCIVFQMSTFFATIFDRYLYLFYFIFQMLRGQKCFIIKEARKILKL